MILDKVNYPSDLKKLTIDEKKQLAEEIREKIINTVSQTGGHLASNLGVVELTIALHSVLNTPEDKIVWDVGHQTYVHKILTGRKKEFETLRKYEGLSGFPKTCESEYDSFDTGHSSTSISVGMGMARARDLKNENYRVISVIGDGALTGGMALEALNDVGTSNTNMIVVLNDNEMSISKNVGGISMLLSKLRVRRFYVRTNVTGKKILNKVPFFGKRIVKFYQKIKKGIKQLIIPKMYFEDIGYKYIGPIDGHDIEKLEDILKLCNEKDGPILLHILTKKGKGYKPAEQNPDKFHSISKFDIETGEKLVKSSVDYSKVFGNKLNELAENNSKIVAITAAMKDGTGLTEFSKKYPNRFFDVGIAEQHALGMAAGLAKAGMIPVVPLYSSFVQRAYDQVVHDIAIQKLPVIICLDRSGVVGNDGETHQGMLDMSILSSIPNVTIMAPKDFKELEEMLEFAVDLNAPVIIRYPRGAEEIKFKKSYKMKKGKAEIISSGNDITILAIGKMVSKAQRIANRLKLDDISVEVINARFFKPLDSKTIIESVNKTKKIITIEDGTIVGGLGKKVEEILYENKINAKFKIFSYPDEFIVHGDIKNLEKKYKIDDSTIYNCAKEMLNKKIEKNNFKNNVKENLKISVKEKIKINVKEKFKERMKNSKNK